MIKSNYTRRAANPIGYSSQSVETTGVIYLCGTLGLSSETNTLVDGGIDGEMKAIISNLTECMKHSFTSWSNVVKMNIYLKDINDFEKVNTYLAEALGDVKPVFTILQISGLMFNANVCIDAVVNTF